MNPALHRVSRTSSHTFRSLFGIGRYVGVGVGECGWVSVWGGVHVWVLVCGCGCTYTCTSLYAYEVGVVVLHLSLFAESKR